MSSEEDEVERFEVTDFDLQDAFYPGRRRKFTKEQAVYGIWAEPDDDADSFRPSFGKKTKQDYTGPMGFISAGFVQKKGEVGELPEGEEDEEENKEDNSETESGNNSPSLKRSEFPNQFTSNKKKTQKTLQPFKTKGDKGKVKNASSNLGSWERHTKGFGKKMLEKMGYVSGKGLGKELEGIVEPVKAFKRSGRGAIGAYGSERPGDKEKVPEYDSEDEEERKIKDEIQQLRQWKKTGKESKKLQYVYKTAEEVKISGPSKKKFTPLVGYSDVKVVDMTGPKARVLSGYSSIGHQHAKPDATEAHPVLAETETKKAFALPELEYNLKLLLDLSESEIVQIDRQLRHEKDMVVNLKYEQEKLDKVVKQEEDEIDNLKNVLNVIERCKQGLIHDKDEPLTLEGLMDVFKMLQDKYYIEYKLYDLDSLVVPLGFPLLQKHFQTWMPLSEQRYGLEVVKLWKDVLEDKNTMQFTREQPNKNQSMGSFERIIWEILMPHIRTSVGQWNPRECDPLIELLETWAPILPEWIISNILDQLVMPRLQAELESWDPMSDPMPVHSWIHPWLPMMGPRLEPVYGPIRHKLATALINWHPSDPSAKLILEPWIKVFTKGTMEAFLLRSIYPKLLKCMADFVINPHQQHLEPFQWVMQWKDFLSQQHIISIFEKHFFPKWIQVLREWLLGDPNYDEVTKWYLGWKSMFDENLLSNPSLKEQFNRALSLMNKAVIGTFRPGAKENVAYLTSTEKRKDAEATAVAAEKAASVGGVPANFKDLVERAAEDNDLIFVPLPSRRYEGKTVYSFGKCTIYIDRGVAFVNSQGKWKPSSLPDLVTLAT